MRLLPLPRGSKAHHQTAALTHQQGRRATAPRPQAQAPTTLVRAAAAARLVLPLPRHAQLWLAGLRLVALPRQRRRWQARLARVRRAVVAATATQRWWPASSPPRSFAWCAPGLQRGPGTRWRLRRAAGPATQERERVSLGGWRWRLAAGMALDSSWGICMHQHCSNCLQSAVS